LRFLRGEQPFFDATLALAAGKSMVIKVVFASAAQ
jgi:hypothetical protein